MLQIARLAPNILGESASRVGEFLADSIHPDGGIKGRDGKSDLYYTVFGLECMIALRLEPPAERIKKYLNGFDGEALDLVHLSCLARAWAALPKGALAPPIARRLADRILSFEARDGGFAPEPGAAGGTVYHSFLAFGALEDLGEEVTSPDRIARSISSLELKDGSFPNRPDVPAGSTPTTAAAVTALRRLGAPAPEGAARWLLDQACPKGGFRAAPDLVLPDLLSTATALHALAGLKTPLEGLKEATLDFIDTLWTGRAFCGSWVDGEPDAEYTYYALLSLGHLSLV